MKYLRRYNEATDDEQILINAFQLHLEDNPDFEVQQVIPESEMRGFGKHRLYIKEDFTHNEEMIKIYNTYINHRQEWHSISTELTNIVLNANKKIIPKIGMMYDIKVGDIEITHSSLDIHKSQDPNCRKIYIISFQYEILKEI